MLEIIYNNGRGRLEINLDSLLPCNAADLERLLYFVNMSSNPAKDAEKIHTHIATKVQELKSARENSTTKDYKEFYTKEIAKLIKNADKLSRVFNLPEIQDEKNNAEKISFTPAAFYSMGGKNGRVVLIQRMGWTFEKSGFHFEIFKEGNKKTRFILLCFPVPV